MAIAKDQYDVVAARRTALNGLMWQTPVLSLTAQAFLFTIALGSGASSFATLMSAVLALAAALASIQLMAKHRCLEVRDSQLLEEYERNSVNGFEVIHSKSSGFNKMLCRWSSYKIWMFMLGVFALAAIIVIIVEICSLACDCGVGFTN